MVFTVQVFFQSVYRSKPSDGSWEVVTIDTVSGDSLYVPFGCALKALTNHSLPVVLCAVTTRSQCLPDGEKGTCVVKPTSAMPKTSSHNKHLISRQTTHMLGRVRAPIRSL